uniref:Phospholipase A2 n=1 Tax=Accipiter nisus TaxID=211598 RepID=A0A8B9N589_9AVES
PPDLPLLVALWLAPAGCDAIQFCSRIKHKTGKSPLSYNAYGCDCSLGGSKQPLDTTDWCCHAHDCCYKKLSSSLTSSKLVTYKYSIWGKSTTRCKRWSHDCNRRVNYPNSLLLDICCAPTPNQAPNPAPLKELGHNTAPTCS